MLSLNHGLDGWLMLNDQLFVFKAHPEVAGCCCVFSFHIFKNVDHHEMTMIFSSCHVFPALSQHAAKILVAKPFFPVNIAVVVACLHCRQLLLPTLK